MENLQNAVHATLPDLEELLGRDAVVGGPAGYGPQSSETAIFQLCAIAVFHPKHDDAAVRYAYLHVWSEGCKESRGSDSTASVMIAHVI